MAALSANRRLAVSLILAIFIGAVAALPSVGRVLAEDAGTPEAGLLPPENLVRGLLLPVRLNLAEAGIREGAWAVDFTLLDTSGQEVSLSGLLQGKPVVLILGSYT